jgi:hopanoid biosynthesis associated RND transporter like protein HpnN
MTTEQLEARESRFIPRLLIGLVLTSARFPRTCLTFTVLLCAISAYGFCTRLTYETRREDLISPTKENQHRWRQFLAEFGNDDDVVVVVKGADPKRMEQALEAVADEVRGQPQLFDRLFYKVDLRLLRDRALLFLRPDQIGAIQENLQSMKLLLELGPVAWRSLTLTGLVHEARVRTGKLAPGAGLSPADEPFLTQLVAISRSATATLDDPTTYRNPWNNLMPETSGQADMLERPRYFFSGDDTLAFLLARPVQEEGSFTGAARSIQKMRDVLAAMRPAYPDLEFGLTGLPVLENDEMVASQQDTNVASWLALAGVAALYLIVFRSFRYPLLTTGTLIVGTLWASGWLTLTVGHLNILSATFAMMLIGMGDYGVLWVTRYEQDRVAGVDVMTAMRNTATSVGLGVLTAATTTALAFYAAMLADFRAVGELGWIAGSGVLLCALSTFTVMPALLVLVDRRERPEPVAMPITCASAWLPALSCRPRWVVGVSLAITALLGVFAVRVHYDHNLLHLQADGLDSVQWEQRLIEHTAAASWHALSITSSPAEALALKARYEKLPEVAQVVEVASLVPEDQDHKLESLRDLQHRLRRLPERDALLAHAPPDLAELRAELGGLTDQLRPLAVASAAPLLGDLRRGLLALQDRLAHVPESDAVRRLQGFEDRLAADLARDLHRLRDSARPAPITLADLPAGLRERYIGRSGKWLLRVFGKDSLWDFGPLAHFVERIRTVDEEATGRPFTFLEGLSAMKTGFQMAGLYALAAIVLVLLLDFRKVTHILLALAPLAMGVLMTLGIMGIFDVTLNPANMIVFPLILGVGVDNGVHVIHDFLEQWHHGRRYRLGRATGWGMFVAALTTILGFGTLMISQHRGLVSLGLVLTLGVTCCMFGALIVLPALLGFVDSWRAPARAVPAAEHEEAVAA